ncbi:hypothetical protein LTR37_000954 [Vermiconidia calcicola]|uniref:Uncharacterized protein n=1 Tax=Vermiconidia calcicola TaxID=1690605 RepID=A0ACC3NXX7_9PEZI|nr:hypothetical protein LTR37_000954 [Vermiconidia calcicola]
MAAESIAQDAPTAAEPSRLQKLPAELRNRIYELVLPRSNVVYAAFESREYIKREIEEPVTQPALTRTCKQIRAEALALFYGALPVWIGRVDNLNHESYLSGWAMWLTAIGAENRSLLKSVFSRRKAEVADMLKVRLGRIDERVNIVPISRKELAAEVEALAYQKFRSDVHRVFFKR